MFKALITYISVNREFIFLLLIWLFTGIYAGPAIYVIIPVSLFLLQRKERYEELFLGFFFILILSDSRQIELGFAADIKVIYMVMLALFLLLDRKSFFPFNTFYQKFIPFFIVAFIALLNSEVFSVSLQKTSSYFLLFLIVPNYVQKLWKEKGEKFFYNLIFLCAIILLAGLMMKFIMPEKVYLDDRFSGILGNPNGLGLFCMMFFLAVSTILYFFPEILNKQEKIFIYCLIFVSVILCGSRSALLSIFVFVFFKYIYKLTPFLGFIIFLLILISYELIASNITPIIIGLGLEEYFRLNTLEGGSGRLVAWYFAWEEIQRNFFIGKGFAHTEFIYKKFADILSRLGHQGNAHNSYLTFWLETGLIGLICFLWGFLKSFIVPAKKHIIAIPILYSIAFSTYLESWLTASLNPFTIQLLIILTMLAYVLYSKENEAEIKN